jgi:ferrochelatase
MAYGGPNNLAEVEPYLSDVRGHRPTPPHVLEEVRRRYEAIGGRSPILERTRAQAAALDAALNTNGHRFAPAVGMRHWRPYIGEALAQLAAAGVRRAVGLVMAPQYSRMSVELYYKEAAHAGSGVELIPILDWHLLPGYLDASTARVRAALGRFPAAERDDVAVLFTAHSLPQRILEWDDPYPAQLTATMNAVIQRLGERPHRFAYQSAAMTKDPWLGPDAGAVIEELAAARHRGIVIAPIGFTCEHVEVLYDVDIEFQRTARELGVRLERIEMVNDDRGMMVGLADLVRDAARAKGWL